MTVTGICENECIALAKILQAAYPIIEYIIQTEEGQTGGVLCIAGERGNPLLFAIFGTMESHDRSEYLFFAQEKASRLAANTGDCSSWQTRNLDANPPQYAGAIRASGKTILSFSGFKEEQDEAAMLVLAMNTDLMVGGPAALIAQISRNAYFRKLQNACGTDSVSLNPLDRYRIVD